MVTINGQNIQAAGQSLAAYLKTTAYDPMRIAVERNGEIIPKAAYEITVLQEDDIIEIVSFVGGG